MDLEVVMKRGYGLSTMVKNSISRESLISWGNQK